MNTEEYWIGGEGGDSERLPIRVHSKFEEL